MAARASAESARCGTRIEYAGLSLAGGAEARLTVDADEDALVANAGRAVHGCGDCRSAGSSRWPYRNGSADRVSARTEVHRHHTGSEGAAMTMGLFRGLLTAVLFIAFTALWVWAWSKRREPEFREAA